MKRFAYAIGILLACFSGSHVYANIINLSFVAAATATDDGPQDGTFDAFAPNNFGSVNNNGFTSFRTAVEFELSALPSGATINSATLSGILANFEGSPRNIQLHGYVGDSSIQLGDFALDGLVGSTSVGVGTLSLVYDITSFISGLLSNNDMFAGFNYREQPGNASNFLVMNLSMTGNPSLSIDFTLAATRAAPEPATLALLALGLAGLGFSRRKQ